MTLRLSTGLRNYVNQVGPVKNALQGGKLKIYTGAQPSSADAAPTGTLLVTITDASGAHTQEVRATGSVTLSGSSGSVDALTVNTQAVIGAAVAFDTDLSTTAENLAAAINAYPSVPKITATSSGAKVTLIAPQGLGTVANGWVVDSTCTTLVGTDVNMGSETAGVSVANGLKFGVSAAGVLVKDTGQTWSGVAGSTGTAGWFRFEGPVADSGALDSSEAQMRLDGAVATSGSQLNLSTTSITSAATQTITAFPITFPSA